MKSEKIREKARDTIAWPNPGVLTPSAGLFLLLSCAECQALFLVDLKSLEGPDCFTLFLFSPQIPDMQSIALLIDFPRSSKNVFMRHSVPKDPKNKTQFFWG